MCSQYDAFAAKFSQTRQYSWAEFDIFLPYLKKGDRILDLGCGNGRLRESLDSNIIQNGNYYGFDLSEELLKIARKKYIQDYFFRGDFGKILPFGKDNFDMVVSIASFHHLLDKKSQQAFFSEVFRVLKPGGKIFLTTWKLPKKYFWSNFWHGRWKNWQIPFGIEKHPRTYRYVTHRELASWLRKTGFNVIESRNFENRNFIALAEKK